MPGTIINPAHHTGMKTHTAVVGNQVDPDHHGDRTMTGVRFNTAPRLHAEIATPTAGIANQAEAIRGMTREDILGTSTRALSNQAELN